MLLSLFTPWVERLATLAWLYAACGAVLLVVAALAALASRRVRGRQPRGVAADGVRPVVEAPNKRITADSTNGFPGSLNGALAAYPRCVSTGRRGRYRVHPLGGLSK